MTLGVIGPADKARIQNLINAGIDTHREIATLKEGLKDTVSAVAEELDTMEGLLKAAGVA